MRRRGGKGGDGLRKTSSFDAAALPPGENPLIRDSNFAPREQVFYSLTGAFTWILGLGLALTFGVLNAIWFEVLEDQQAVRRHVD
jgi:cytochrome bd-I ubiquinol oxidase subunit X